MFLKGREFPPSLLSLVEAQMQSQGPKKVGSWRVSRELRGLQESFCSKGVLHEGGELHNEPRPEDSGEKELLRGSSIGGEAGTGRSSLKDTRGKSPRCEGLGYSQGLCAPQSPKFAPEGSRGTPRVITFFDPDTLESEEDPDPSWEEWSGEDGSGEGSASDGSDGESHGCAEEL